MQPEQVETVRRRFTRERFADITPCREAPLARGLLPRQGVGFMVGPSTGGKTFLALEMALRISRGETIAGHNTREGGVLYVGAEDAPGIRKRLTAWRQENDARGALQLIPQAPNLIDPADVEQLILEVADGAYELAADGAPLSLIIVDTMSKATPGADHNTAKDMGPVMTSLADMATRFDCLVLVVAHPPKDETRGISGWYGQFAGADAVISVTRDGEDEDLRVATVLKLKNGPEGTRLAFRLKVIDIGEDEEGDALTSCIIQFENAPTATKAKRSAKLQDADKIVLRALNYVIDGGNAVTPPPWPGVSSTTLAASKAAVKTRAIASGFADADEKPNTVTQRFGRSVSRLVALDLVRQEGELIWPIRVSDK